MTAEESAGVQEETLESLEGTADGTVEGIVEGSSGEVDVGSGVTGE